jgi:hypothetical protein
LGNAFGINWAADHNLTLRLTAARMVLPRTVESLSYSNSKYPTAVSVVRAHVIGRRFPASAGMTLSVFPATSNGESLMQIMQEAK